MADFAEVHALRGPKLSDLAEHVSDVLALSLVPADEYEVGKLVMAAYDFVPFAVTGLAAAMQTPAAGVRPTTVVTLPLGDDTGAGTSATQDVTLFGPGDVLGVDPGQIVRRYPSQGSTNAEETFHAHIEFDRPELPWAFSAHTPGDQMPAWLALVVFEHDEVEWEPAHAGLQPIAVVAASLLPPLDTAWAWAHAQAVSGSSSLSARLSTAYAAVNVSRLIAARVLTQNTNYIACLVPTTDAGRKAGLGLDGGTLGPAWTATDGTVRLPVYDRWEFRTAPDGDFARLARRLKGVAAPWQIGRRTLDASRPGDPLADLAVADLGRRQVIKCALFSPAPEPAGGPSDAAHWNAAETAALKAALERPGVIEGTAGTDPGAIPDLPIVGPRLYAKGQRGTATVPEGDWFAELNLAPVNRVVAGLGTRVVAKDQEPLMQSAWAQVGAIDKANRELRLAELARNLATTLHGRLEQLELGRLLQITRPLSARIRLDGAALTLAGQTTRSATPPAALSGAFRRAIRATGPVTRRLAPAERAALTNVVASGEGFRDFTRPYRELDGIGGLSETALGSLDATAVARALKVEPGEALTFVARAAATLSAGPSLATAVTTPAVWGDADTSFQPGVAATERIVDTIRRLAPTDAGNDSVRARFVGGLAAGVAVTGVEATVALHDLALTLESSVNVGRMTVVPSTVAPSHLTPTHVAPTQIDLTEGAPAHVGAVHVGPATGALTHGAPQHGFVAPLEVMPDLNLVATTHDGGAGLTLAAGAGAGHATGTLSARASGSLLGSILRPTQLPVGGDPGSGGDAPGLSDSARLERFRTAQGTALGAWIEQAHRVTVADVRTGIAALIDSTGALAVAPTPARDVLAVERTALLARLEPTRTVIDTTRARVSTGALAFNPFVGGFIRPIMAAPRFDRPMYQALDAYNRDWLVPGLSTLREPELVTLLSTNDTFTESFLIGLSDEMGRELQWRNFPTDNRGTYFHRFWHPESDELGQQIARFSATGLGSHLGTGSPAGSGRAVIVIRGELVRRYPDVTVMALHETGRDPDTGHPLLPEAPTGAPDAAQSLFHAMLPPDVMLVGLDIAVDTLRQPGWWIVLAEHPQAMRFRRQEGDLGAHEARFAAPGALADGAAVAKARLENPTRIAFEAAEFLPSVS